MDFFRVQETKAQDVKKLKYDSASKGTPLEYLLTETLAIQQTVAGTVQEGAVLPFHVC